MIENELVHMEDNIINAETVKSLVLNRLLDDEIITKKQHDLYYIEYNMIIVRPSWFKNWINKFKKHENKGFVYKYVKF